MPQTIPHCNYAGRQRRITKAQKRTLNNPNEQFFINLSSTSLDQQNIFTTTTGKKIVEIGFGNGSNLIATALSRPQDLFIGIEMYLSGIASLLMAIDKQQIDNIRIIKAEATAAIQTLFASDAIDEVWIFFPDPWPKKRHHKRRLVQSYFIELLHHKLKKGGLLHIATDWQDYAYDMLTILQKDPGYRNLYDRFAPAQVNHRHMTKFEYKARQQRAEIFELLFTKI